MTRQDAIALFTGMHPGFFEREDIKRIPAEVVCEEMILSLDAFDPNRYTREFDGTVSFGYYQGDLSELKKLVERVEPGWLPFYNQPERIFCGLINGKVASFCLVEEMGTYRIDGREARIGGPGCVGTLPEYRNRGIGLTMVKLVTSRLKEMGYDYSYIHYTGVAPWYAKLGYQTCLRWSGRGIVD